MIRSFDLAKTPVRALNQTLHDLDRDCRDQFVVSNPNGAHAVACGIDAPCEVTIQGHTGYYCAGMHKQGKVTIEGNVGVGVAENMMSGRVHVKGNASQSAAATAHGGLLIVEGDAAARCGISLKGGDIVVKGSVGHMSCFMAQAGRVVVCGDAGEALGDSLYEVRIYLKGGVESLGADCIEKEMHDEHIQELRELLDRASVDEDPRGFRRYGSARRLYCFNVDDAVL